MRSVTRTVLAVTLSFFAAVPSFARTKPLRGPVERIRAAAAREGVVRIIIGVDVAGYASEGRLKGQAIAEQRRNIHATQQRVLHAHRRVSVVEGHQYITIPAMAVDVDKATFEDLINDDDVTAVEENTIMHAALRDVTRIIWMNEAPLADGSGYSIAVFDTGIAAKDPTRAHTFLKNASGGSRVTYEACFSTSTGSFVSTCPNGGPSDLSARSGEPCDLATTSICGHGTLVAGTAAGYISAAPDTGEALSGIASGASLMAFKIVSVLGEQHVFQLIDIQHAIDHINANYSTSFNKLVAINMSFATDNVASAPPGYYTSRQQCQDDHQTFLYSVGEMRDHDIAIVAATGNEGHSADFSFPACMPGVIAVAATTKSDVMWPLSNSTYEVDLLAPGAAVDDSHGLYAGVLRLNAGGTLDLNVYSQTFLEATTVRPAVMNEGTSLAVPEVAGAIAVMKQRSPLKTMTAIRDALVRTGTPITDYRNYSVLPRINLALAADNLPPTAPGNLVTTGSSTSVTLNWSASSDEHGIDHYAIFRRAFPSFQFQDIGHTATTTYTDTDVSTGRMYEYYVAAYDPAQNGAAGSHRYGVTVSYTNDPIGDSVLIYGRHIGELRQAIDAWRRFVSLAPQWSSYSDPTGLIYADDVNSLISALNPARQALGLGSFTYSIGVTTPATNILISRRHVQELRDALK